jgi:hypothetical protein
MAGAARCGAGACALPDVTRAPLLPLAGRLLGPSGARRKAERLGHSEDSGWPPGRLSGRQVSSDEGGGRRAEARSRGAARAALMRV